MLRIEDQCRCNTGRTFKVVTLVAVIFLAALTGGAAFGQDQASSEVPFPRGNWSGHASPYMGPGYETLPVRITRVTNNISGGITVTQVSIQNNSSQTVTAVKLGWYLSPRENRGSILLQGETRLLRIRDGLEPRVTSMGSIPKDVQTVLSFTRISQPLVKEGVLNGEFVLQIFVSEVTNEDGSTQRIANSKPAKAPWFTRTNITDPTPICPNQGCERVTDPSTMLPIGFRCGVAGSVPGISCQNAPDGKSCTESICSMTGGGGIGMILE